MASSITWHYITSGDIKNPALLMLHGFLGASSDWNDLIQSLTNEHYCIAVDLPGHGETKVDTDEDFSMERCSEGLVALLDELQLSRCAVIGYSMGGRLALYMALNYPDRFNKVILESASPGLKTEAERLARIEQDEQLVETMSSIPLADFLHRWYDQPLFSTLDKSDPTFKKMLAARAQNSVDGLGRSLKMMGTGAQPPLWSRLAEIKADTLLITGQLDTKFTNIGNEMAAHGDRITVKTISNAGHNVHFEKPEEYIEQVRLFLKT